MEFSGLDLYLIMIFPVIYVEAGLNLDKDNVCLKSITFNETIKGLVPRPPSKKDTILCLKEGKYSRCNEEISIDVKEPRVITRTKIVPTCCEGYEEDLEGTHCVPVCPKGCGNGKCVAPRVCSCEAGFFGSECDEICGEDRWGENCLRECNCSENQFCDKMSGCMCRPGWIGVRCTTPCPEGYFGFQCKEKCHCGDHFCNHITGTCIKSVEVPSTVSEINISHHPTSPSTNVAIKQTLINVEDVLNEADFSANTSPTEIFYSDTTPTVDETDEVTTPEQIYIKPVAVEDGKNSGEPPRAQNLTPPVYETNFKPVKNLQEQVQLPDTSAKLNTPKNTKSIHFLTDLTKNLTTLAENVLQENELFNSPDGQSTATDNVKSSRVSNFIPTFTVLSGFSALILLIAGKWLIVTLRNRVRKMVNVEFGCSDEVLSMLPSEKFTLEDNLDNPAYMSEIVKTVPVLQTFKPPTAEPENKPTENKISLVSE